MSQADNSRNHAFAFLRTNQRDSKPRSRGITELRGPYYHPVGVQYLHDIFDTMGEYVDILKFGGGAMPLMPASELKRIITLCHDNNVMVSTGGLLEYVITQGAFAIDSFFDECKKLEFDVIEVSTGMLTVPVDDVVQLVRRVRDLGMKPKPEIGIQFGAGGTSTPAALAAIGVGDLELAILKAQKCLEAGAELIMIESEGITEQVAEWRVDVVGKFVSALGIENLMFEAADFDVFPWYIQNYGPEVNLFVDHSQITALESLRSGTWGTNNLWGRVITVKE